MSSSMLPESTSSPADNASVGEDFFDIFYAPATVFRRRANGNFWVPLFVTTIVIAVLTFVNRNIMRAIIDAEFARRAPAMMKQNPQLTEAAINKIRDYSFVVGQYGSVIFVPILILISAFILWLLIKAFGTRISWHSALVVAAYAAVANMVQSIVLAIQGLLMNPSAVTAARSIEIGPGRFVNSATLSPVLGSVYDRLDIFVLWSVVLVAIGAAVIGRMSKGKAFAFGVAYWVVLWLPGLWGAIRQG